MGLGDIIATGIMIIVLIVAGYLVIASLSYTADTAAASLATVRDACDDRLQAAVAVEIKEIAAGRIDCNLTNAGDRPIDNVTAMDLFVKTIAGDRVTGCAWVPYVNTSATGTDHWYVLERPPARGGADSLGPGEMMIIRCVLADASASDGLVEVATPCGVTAAGYYLAP